MADKSDDEFDEAILNQPWDPVSYFDEEENNERTVENGTESNSAFKPSSLFETNLSSVENDLQKIMHRRQSEHDVVVGLTQENMNLDGTDGTVIESDGTMGGFITYEDAEDHLRAVDSTVVINQRNVNDDIKRFAHFKQNSMEENYFQDESTVNKYQNGALVPDNSIFTIDETPALENMINLMPDVVQDLPNVETEDTEFSHNQIINDVANTQLDMQDIDIDSLLPDVVTEDPSETASSNEAHFESNDLTNITSLNHDYPLIDLDPEDFNIRETDQNSAIITNLSRNGSMETHQLIPEGDDHGVDEIIKEAESIVNNFKEASISKNAGEEMKDHEGTTKSNGDCSVDSKLERLGFEGLDARHGASENYLEENFDTSCEPVADLLLNMDTSNTSVSSLHDELVCASPGFDFQEPSFSNDVDLTSTDLSPQQHDKALATGLSSTDSLSVKKRTENLSKKPPGYHKKSNKQKYIVQIVKSNDNVTQLSDESGSDNDISPRSDVSDDIDLQKKANWPEVPSTKVLEKQVLEEQDGTEKGSSECTEEHANEGTLNTISLDNESESQLEAVPGPGLSTDHETNELSSTAFDPQLEAISSDSQQMLDQNTSHVGGESTGQESGNHPTDVSNDDAMSDEILRITNEISDHLASQVIGDTPHESDTENQEPHNSHSSAVHGTDVDGTVGPDGNIQNTDEDMMISTATGRTGSTSESEELEEFINQQLNSAASASTTESTNPSVPPNITQQAVEEIQLGWYAPKWIPDKDAKACMSCGMKFTVVKRRHHCRACGKVMCANCCNMKADLPYLGYKSGRVCQACHEVFNRAQSLLPLPLMSGSQDVPGRGHTISLNDTEASTPITEESPPQYMPNSPPEYSLIPGGAVQSGPPNPPSYFASSGRNSRSRTESERSVVIMFNSSQTDLPPVLRIENEVVKIINNPNLQSLFQQMKDPAADPVAFLVNKNLVIKLKIIQFDCCIGKSCWCFSSDGMGASNQEEIIFIVEYLGDDARLLKCVFQQLNSIFERAKHGEPVSDLGYISFDDYMLNNPKNVGILLFKQTVQCVKNIFVPCHPHLFGIWVQENEVPWAKNLPLRLLLRLGAEYKQYPCPIYNLVKRDPVYNVIGRTIVELLADFRNYQYSLPRIAGLLISVSKKETLIKLPQSRYDEILKVLNVSEENVLAFCGNFNRKADSHLVCVENDGTYSTQSITCRSSSRKVTGCSFVVFSAALKQSSQNSQAKTSVVEDGVMIQVTAETMKKIRSSMKEMQDFTSSSGEQEEGSGVSGRVKIVWGSTEDPSSRTTSPIDGSSFDGLTNMRIRHSYDFTVTTSPAKIHWQEVYFLPNDADTVGRLSAKELSQMTSSVAKACMNALSPHLSTLVALAMTKIGLRITLDSDSVEYRVGSNEEQLPQELTGELDDKLIPVIHAVMKTVPHRRVSAELIFQIARIV